MKYLLLLLPLFVASCAGVPEQYVKADRATFEALTPYVERCVEKDDDLDETEKKLKLLVIKTWDMRVTEAEEATK